MIKANQDIRSAAKDNKVALWQIAAAIGISEFTFVRWMRSELSPERKQQIFSVIDNLSEQ